MNTCLLLSKILGSRKGPPPTPTYSISGTITGTVVEGVTVTLSGDADDSTTSAVDGTYSFTGLVDGSYTVTPTLANYAFTADHEDVEVSGDDVVVDDMVSHINVFLGFDEDTLGGEIGSVSDWVYGASNTNTSVIETMASDSVTLPTSFTKRATTTNTALITEYLLNVGALPKAGKVRIAALVAGTGTGRNWQLGLLNAGATGWLAGDPPTTDRCWMLLSTGQNPDNMFCYVAFPGTAVEISPGATSGVNLLPARWTWQRLELDYDTSTVRWHCYEPSTDTITTVRSDSFPVGLAARTFAQVFLSHSSAGDYANVTLGGIWVNTGGDDWPTT